MESRSGSIKLRGFKESDSRRIADLANNENISKNLRDFFPSPYTEEDAVIFIGMCRIEDPKVTFLIEYDGEPAGCIGFEKLGLVRIFSGVFDFNKASQKVLEKAGFYLECISKRAVYKRGKILDEYRYAKIKAE